MISDFVSRFGDTPDEGWMPFRSLPDEKKRGLDSAGFEFVEQSGCVFRVRTVVKRQRDGRPAGMPKGRTAAQLSPLSQKEAPGQHPVEC